MSRIWRILTRKKAIDPVSVEETRLNRVLNVFDLTALGVGSTLGVGVYVLAGQVAKTTAGPSVILSFLIAAVASVFAGLCYAEFGARAPRAGSAYIYSYVCVGEFIAFVIGWNLILEYVIGSASVARGLSVYLDTLLNNTLQDTFREIAPMNVSYLAAYFDFFSFGISILLSVGLAFGLKESSMVNNIVTCLNILVVLFIIIAGSLKANPANWHVTPNNTNITNSTIIGEGGFFPWGVSGMIKGAATCFYGFVGFDCIATTGEEVKNPRRAIPISIVLSLSIIFLAYFGVATVLTLMVPYYEQDAGAPIPKAFEMMGWDVAKWIVAIGALFGLCASLFGAMFPLPRIIYAMGSDGLVFKFLAKVHPKFQTPVVGTILAGVLTGLMSALFDLSQLVNMMSIGTLQAYTIVAASVLLLRYKGEAKKLYIQVKTSSDTESVSSEGSLDEKYNDDRIRQNFDGPTTSDEQELLSNDSPGFFSSFTYIINCRIKEPNKVTEGIVAVEVLLYCLLCVGISLCAIYLKSNIADRELWAIALTSVIVGLAIIVLLSLVTQPKSTKELSFKVPFVPLIPALSILVNIYLMLMLDYMTWVRFAVWMAVGIPMYCVCACIKKPPPKAVNGTNYRNNITNGLGKPPTGIANPGFVPTGQETRKKAAPPPPTISEQNETIEALAQLDEILENEAVKSRLDGVIDDETVRISDRKLSAGTLSDVSAVASRSEDVVADVHCANVVTPVVADPEICPPPPSFRLFNDSCRAETVAPSGGDSPEPNTAANEKQLAGKNLGDGEEAVLNDIEDKLEETAAAQNVGNFEKESSGDELTAPDLQTADATVAAAQNLDNLEEESCGGEPADLGKTPQKAPSCPVASNFANFDSTVVNEAKKGNENSIKPSPDSNEPPPMPSPIPTKEALKTITLRHVQKQIKQIELTATPAASDDNLKIGSPEYKNFVKNLDDKLKRLTVIPTFYVPPPPKNGVAVPPKAVAPVNENVIEDPIDRGDAKEKLKRFYARKNDSPSQAPNGGGGGDAENSALESQNDDADDVGSSFPNNNNTNSDDSVRGRKLQMDDLFKTIRGMRKGDVENDGKTHL